MAIKQRTRSLKSRGNQLSDTFIQLKVLNDNEKFGKDLPLFSDKVQMDITSQLKPSTIDIFQINIGKLCNQSCAHCHVDAGPDRKEENMSKETLQKCLEIIKQTSSIHTVDITGGAPEMNSHFRWFVREVRKAGRKVMDRCNLTILKANKKYSDLPYFFAENEVHIVSSLPYFSKSRTDSQRGEGVFQDSISALQMLNEAGYGRSGSGLTLDLVYNPSGAFLPAPQAGLESEFKRQLKNRFGVDFNSLYAITNMPISRFLDYLLESGNYIDYMEKLIAAYNPSTLEGLMCRNTVSVGWDGYIYDCDFNQMLELKVDSPSFHLDHWDAFLLSQRTIRTDQHCYGCTAGAGSSCGGEIV
ncbi:MAG TPA: arsenosugar biosynthesis radical SAM protein ArsS [Saprospiraceae bacterium]|nr:arsenosugar biosynthesis radical SAM protein ArsS [Saprospiraceae bacterium]